MYRSQVTVTTESLRCRAIHVLSKQTMSSDIHAEHTVDAEQTKCWVIVSINAKHTMYCLVVCNGTNNYVNHFWANIWKVQENVEIRMNTFQFPMCLGCSQSKNGEGLSGNRWWNLSRRFLPNHGSHTSIYGEWISSHLWGEEEEKNFILVKFL